MTRRKYLAACMLCDVEWLKLSVEWPSAYMTRTHILLHYLAIRRKGG